ncbi:EpsIM glycosyltransferase [Lactobacillus crispatus]|uniref:glycosyltransferase n=1 Tax=Lactobacillus crispatus TaxID=47770 RepID=UPI0018E2AF16|nr:glycosyltransferase [Lactobacillus crispatus]MBI1694382.1 EpsIM glycosyltransferase [Lactobacillus crispatus]
MKVLMINTIKLEKNGVTTFILNSCSSLRDEKVNVSIGASNNIDPELQKILNNKQIAFIKLPNRKKNIFKYFTFLIKILTQQQYDVVHINGNSTTMAIELLAAKVAGIKVRVAHSHNTLTEHPILNKIFRPLFESTVNGRVACNVAAGKWLFGKQKFLVIKNGIFFNKYKFNQKKRKIVREKLDLSENDILLGHVGFFNYQKNQEFFLKLISQLNDNYKIVLLGNGQLFNEFKTKLDKTKFKDRFFLMGAVDNIPDYLSAMDIFLLPSKFEGQPFVIIEALATGLPCIISDKVSKEIDISNNSFFIPLKPYKWKECVLGIKDHNRVIKSLNNQKALKLSGYDASSNGKILKEYYLSCINERG